MNKCRFPKLATKTCLPLGRTTHVTRPWCWSIGSPSATRILCLPCCVKYPSRPSMVLTQVSISASSIMPTTVSSNNAQATGMKVSTFLREEKRSCKDLQKKILSETSQGPAKVAQTADKKQRTCHSPYPKEKASASKPSTTEQKWESPMSSPKCSGRRRGAVQTSKDTSVDLHLIVCCWH